MTSLSFPNPEIGIETLVFGLMITFYAMMILAPSPAHIFRHLLRHLLLSATPSKLS